jgi:hypothetical protein
MGKAFFHPWPGEVCVKIRVVTRVTYIAIVVLDLNY